MEKSELKIIQDQEPQTDKEDKLPEGEGGGCLPLMQVRVVCCVLGQCVCPSHHTGFITSLTHLRQSSLHGIVAIHFIFGCIDGVVVLFTGSGITKLIDIHY